MPRKDRKARSWAGHKQRPREVSAGAGTVGVNGLCTCPCVIGELDPRRPWVVTAQGFSPSLFQPTQASMCLLFYLHMLARISEELLTATLLVFLPHSSTSTLSFYLLSPLKHILLTSQVTPVSLSVVDDPQPFVSLPSSLPLGALIWSAPLLAFGMLWPLCFFFWALSSHSV